MPAKLAVVSKTRLPADPVSASIRDHAKALREIAEAIRENTEQRKEADAFWSKTSHRCDTAWSFMRRRSWLILTSIPGVLMMVGAITPKLGEGLGHALEALARAAGH